MMTAVRSFRLWVVLCVLTFAGCSEGLMDYPSSDGPDHAVPSKLRFAELVVDTNAPSYILGLNDPVLTADKLLKRYTLIQEYKLLKRYDQPYAMVVVFGREDEEDDDDIEEEIEVILAEMDADPDVLWMEPDLPLYLPGVSLSETNGASQALPWGIGRVGTAPGTVSDVDLYILDSGMYPRDINLVEVVDFVQDSVLADGMMHGYHVAGTAAALDNEEGVVGVAPGVQVHGFRVLDHLGQTQTSIVVEALDTIMTRKAANPTRPFVVNLSLGGDLGSETYGALDEAVEAAVAAGIVVVVSAGNEGRDASTFTPAHAAGAITVGAFDFYDKYASFSNYGAVVDILAPGVDILSLAGYDAQGNPLLALSSGTSMAAPHVAGAAAAYLQHHPAATPAEVRAALVEAARPDITDVPGGTTNRAVVVPVVGQ